ncbi:MAG: PilW family protein [Bacillota bacterium]
MSAWTCLQTSWSTEAKRFSLRSRGLSLVELMISLAICAMLLTAVAAAFRASTAAIEDNDQFFRASQAARVAMNQLLTQLRRSDVIDVPSGNPTNRIDFAGDDKIDRAFLYTPDASGKKGTLTLLIDKSGVITTAVLARDVTVAFYVDVVHPASGSGDYVERVTVDMTTEFGNNIVHLTGSAAPRRVLIYR